MAYQKDDVVNTLKITSKQDIIEVDKPNYSQCGYLGEQSQTCQPVCNGFFEGSGNPCCPKTAYGALTVEGSIVAGKGVKVGFTPREICGTIRYNCNQFEGFNGTDWVVFNGGGSCHCSDSISGIVVVVSDVCVAPNVAIMPDPATLPVDTSLSVGPNPAGNGFLTAQPPTPGNILGGNCRGIKAVDWQMAREDPTDVAGGDWSVISGGKDNNINSDADYTNIGGGFGNGISSASYSTIGGGANNGINANGNSNNSQGCAIAGGVGNTINDNMNSFVDYTAIGGGFNNVVGSNTGGNVIYSVISGGVSNEIQQFPNGTARASVISGGSHNIIAQSDSADYSAIGGGILNVINSSCATIAGGYQNTVNSAAIGASIGGGALNTANSMYDVIAGGFGNTTFVDYSAIGGGRGNKIFSISSFIGGGTNNLISSDGLNNLIAGGQGNQIFSDGNAVTIGGGISNKIFDNSIKSTISGGNANVIGRTDIGTTIAGGSINTTGTNLNCCNISGGKSNALGDNCSFSNISGGNLNNINSGSANSTIGGGSTNTIASSVSNSVIAGGMSNTVSGDNSAIGGGNSNAISSGANDVIAGGRNNNISATDSFIGGGRANVVNAVSSGICDGDANHIDIGGFYNFIGGGQFNHITTDCASSNIGGGFSNQILAGIRFSNIGGGNANNISTESGFIGGGVSNNIGTGDLTTVYNIITGGHQNRINNNVLASTIGGGDSNVISNSNQYSTISGGHSNNISQSAYAGVIAGGESNFISSNTQNCNISGGFNNQINNANFGANIGGGLSNIIQQSFGATTNFSMASITGGNGNRILSTGLAQHTIVGGYALTLSTDAVSSHNSNLQVARAVCGQYNTETVNTASDILTSAGKTISNRVFVVGCGSSGVGFNVFSVDGEGNAFAAGKYYSGGADYAEYLESADGSAISIGTVVGFDSNGKLIANADAIGVISANPNLIGNAYEEEWHGKYERDFLGRIAYEDKEVIEEEPEMHIYKEMEKTVVERDGKLVEIEVEVEKRGELYDVVPIHSAETGEVIRTGMVARKKKIVKKVRIPKISNEFNPNIPYVPRSKRPEWNLVGLLGQIAIKKGQKTNERWAKIKDLNEEWELWLVR